MENFEKIAIGLVLFVVTSIVAYLFRMRQLYVVVPKLFRHAQISQNGSLCELLVYNKGNQVEEDIQVTLDSELKGELLASSSSGISFDGSTLKIERLHKGMEASVVLLIERGLLDSAKIISVSSKGAKGRVVKKTSDMPPNYARAFLFLVFYVALIPVVLYGDKAYYRVKAAYVESQLVSSYKIGWSNLGRYYDSDLRKSYSNQEFPIKAIRGNGKIDGSNMLEFEIYNKTALPMEVSVNRKMAPLGDISNFASVVVPPMTKAPLAVRKPDLTADPGSQELRFNIRFGEEFVHSLIYVIGAK